MLVYWSPRLPCPLSDNQFPPKDPWYHTDTYLDMVSKHLSHASLLRTMIWFFLPASLKNGIMLTSSSSGKKVMENGKGAVLSLKYNSGTCMVVQRLRLYTPEAGGRGLTPGQRTGSHLSQLRVRTLQMKTPHATKKTGNPRATTTTWHSQVKKWNKYWN